eukprot:CAMPEP_0119549880 /NCGR_PEP_ID=MMETSP1352-20130426/3502_1 /TAXON_ID=265584 /ORGANISM="Stauroneis constricta, Strain CCMP1120" /LENGTH=360 /DNA_ID=CAMNT_0007595565 /DNA_START=369 /DNA_END=1451 /DNA_ORIENTATION=+
MTWETAFDASVIQWGKGITMEMMNGLRSQPSEGETPASSPLQQSAASTAATQSCRLIGPASVHGMASCPCCKRQPRAERRETVGDLAGNRAQQQSRHSLPANFGSLLDLNDGESSDEDLDDVDKMLPGILSDGVAYTVTSVIVQGWVHKKGTGHDWIGSRAWKARWAVLATAKVAGHDVDVPLLLIYWYSSSTSPSSVIMLNSTVILPEDDLDKEKWSCYKFKIRHAKPSTNGEMDNVTRVFCCPENGRDAWVSTINHTLLRYEKQKSQFKAKSGRNNIRSPTRTRFSVPQDYFPGRNQSHRHQKSGSKLLSPPNSPTPPSPSTPSSPRSRGLLIPKPQREDRLLGEAFLIDEFARTAIE